MYASNEGKVLQWLKDKKSVLAMIVPDMSVKVAAVNIAIFGCF
jgi:hypothetical protein